MLKRSMLNRKIYLLKLLIPVLILFILLSVDCIHKKSTDFPFQIIKVHVKNLEGQSRLEEIIDTTWIVPLESNENCFIKEVRKIEEVSGGYIILDKRAKKVLKFDLNGKYVLSYGNEGRGPSEYIECDDFFVLGDTVIVGSGDERKLLYYLDNGTFVKSLKLPDYFDKFIFLNPDTLIFESYGVSDYKLNYYSIPSKVVYQKFFLYTKFNSASLLKSFVKTETGFLYKYYQNDTIYKITPEGPKIHKVFDFGHLRMTTKSYNDGVSSKNFATDYFFQENKDWNIMRFSYSSGNYLGIQKIENNKFYLFDTYKDLKLKILPVIPTILGYSYPQNAFIGFYFPSGMKYLYQKASKADNADIYYNKEYKKLGDFVDRFPITENPVLFFLRLK